MDEAIYEHLLTTYGARPGVQVFRRNGRSVICWLPCSKITIDVADGKAHFRAVRHVHLDLADPDSIDKLDRLITVTINDHQGTMP